MSTLIRVGKLVMTPKQLKRAYDEDMTVSQALKMIEDDQRREYERLSPTVGDVENNPSVSTGD